ncbi:MAG: LysE family translocator [Bacteroidia bacterium]
MNEVLAFLLAAAISFWGSLQLGPVNVCVIQTALAHGKRQALIVATGGALPEIIYASLAVWGASIIEKHPTIMTVFGWLVVVLLLALGIYYFLKPYHKQEIKPSAGAGFAKGFMLAIFNPQLFPFWLGVLVYMKGFIHFGNGLFSAPYLTFVLGTAVGAWLLLFTFTKLAIAYKEKLNSILKHNLNKIVGSLFIILALVELVRRVFIG